MFWQEQNEPANDRRQLRGEGTWAQLIGTLLDPETAMVQGCQLQEGLTTLSILKGKCASNSNAHQQGADYVCVEEPTVGYSVAQKRAQIM